MAVDITLTSQLRSTPSKPQVCIKLIKELMNVLRFAALLAMSLKAVWVFGELVGSWKKTQSTGIIARRKYSSYVEAPAAHRNPCLK
jgi:hypothetical protein